MINILFDQYQRYKRVEEIINSFRKEDENFTILEVGANTHRNLEKFLCSDKIMYLDIELDEALKQDKQFILGDATSMDIEDDTYDFIVALDVFEHVPREKRRDFISEITRVAKRGFVIMAPFDTEGVKETEIAVNSFYKGLTGKDHPWLIEHISYGLPNLEQTKEYLEGLPIQYRISSHGNLLIWENMIKYHFMSVYNGSVLEDIDKINSYYNQYIYKADTRGNCYRTIIIGTKGEEIEFSYLLEENTDKWNDFNQLQAQFTKKLLDSYTSSRESELTREHIQNIERENKLKEQHIQNIECENKLKEQHIQNIELENKLKEQHIQNIEQLIKAKDNHIFNIESINEKVQQQVDTYEQEIELKQNHINNLEAHIKSLEEQLSLSVRQSQKYEKELDRLYKTFIGKLLKKLSRRL